MPNQTFIHRIPTLLIAACAFGQPVIAADNPGAHEHGSARLQMAVEDNRIDLMFTSPAYNLAGFEHEARTDEQKQKLAGIRQWLQTNALINTESNACKVTAATVELGGDSESHGTHEHHDEHHHSDHHEEKDEDKHGHGDNHDDKSTHRDYEVAQQLECDSDISRQAFNSPLMSRFPELKELSVEWVSASGQGSARITSPDTSFSPGN